MADESGDEKVALWVEWMVDRLEVYWDVYWADRKVIDL